MHEIKIEKNKIKSLHNHELKKTNKSLIDQPPEAARDLTLHPLPSPLLQVYWSPLQCCLQQPESLYCTFLLRDNNVIMN